MKGSIVMIYICVNFSECEAIKTDSMLKYILCVIKKVMITFIIGLYANK